MKNIKKFESFESNDTDELKEYIDILEKGIIKRNELIYAIIRSNSHGYMHFMTDKSMGIDELCKQFKTDDIPNIERIKERIKLLGKELR